MLILSKLNRVMHVSCQMVFTLSKFPKCITEFGRSNMPWWSRSFDYLLDSDANHYIFVYINFLLKYFLKFQHCLSSSIVSKFCFEIIIDTTHWLATWTVYHWKPIFSWGNQSLDYLRKKCKRCTNLVLCFHIVWQRRQLCNHSFLASVSFINWCSVLIIMCTDMVVIFTVFFVCLRLCIAIVYWIEMVVIGMKTNIVCDVL